MDTGFKSMATGILGLKEKLWLQVLKSELLALGMAVGLCVMPGKISPQFQLWLEWCFVKAK